MGRAAVILIAVVVVALLIMMILFLASPAAPWISSGHPSAQSHTGGGSSTTSTTATTSPAAQTSTATTTTTKTPPTAPPPTTTTTTTKAPSAQNLLKLNVTRVIIDTLDPPRYADYIVSYRSIYDLNYVNKLRQSEFVIVEIALINTLNRELRLRPESFVLITDKGEYPSAVFDDFSDIVFEFLHKAFVYPPVAIWYNVNPGYVVKSQLVTFIVPKGAVVKGLALVDGGVRLAEVPIDSNMVSYLSVIRSIRVFSNDTSVKVDLGILTPMYVADKVAEIKVYIDPYDALRTVALVGIDIVVNSTHERMRGQLSRDLPVTEGLFFGSPITIPVELPPGEGPWDINITLYFAYYPTWRIEVNSVINDTADAVKLGYSGKTYLIYNVTVYFKGHGNSRGFLRASNFRLVTSDGVYGPADKCCPSAAEKALPPWDIEQVYNDTSKQFQLVFLVPTSAKPLYLLLVSSYGEVLERIPVNNVTLMYCSVIDRIYLKQNVSDVSIYIPGIPKLYMLTGQKYYLNVRIDVWYPEKNYTLVGVDVSPPFKLVAIYPNIIGKVLGKSTDIQLEIAGPEGSHYFNSMTVTFYFRRGGSGK